MAERDTQSSSTNTSLEAPSVLRIGEDVTLSYDPRSSADRVQLEWRGGADTDPIADAVVALVLGAGADAEAGLSELERGRAEALRGGDAARAEAAETDILRLLLEAQFGPAALDPATGLLFLDVDGAHVLVDRKSRAVQCADEPLRARVQAAVTRAVGAMQACPVGVDVMDQS